MAQKITIQEIFELIGDMNTDVVGCYFRQRGFETIRLDEKDSQLRNCDWLVDPSGSSFLCEVKTVTSVQRSVLAEGDFRRLFENAAHYYFANRKDLQSLPYHLHFHSDSLRLPGGNDANRAVNGCLASVGKLLLALSENDKQPDIWFVDNCCDGALDLTITPSLSGQLELEVSKYGEVNFRTIESSLSNAIAQVNRSGQDYPDIPRLVVFAFASDVFITSKSEVVVFDGLAFQKEELWKLIDRVMKRHPELSAVAVMARQANPHFDVFHNSKVSKVPALDVNVFEDGRAVQFDSLETIPRVRIQPFDLQKQFEALLAAATEVNEIPSITLSDYDALRKKNR